MNSKMQKLGFFRQLRILLKFCFKNDISDKDRFMSTILFSIIILLLFNITFGTSDPEVVINYFIAEVFLTVFLALQISFSRIFDPESKDNIIQLLRIYPINYYAFFLAKYLTVLASSVLTLLITILISNFLLQTPGVNLITFDFVFITLIVIIGQTAIGLVASLLTLQSSSKQTIFPLLYYPITLPLLMIGVQTAYQVYSPKVIDGSTSYNSWVYLLLLIDVVYFSVSMLLFSELLETESTL